ncbi:MAG: DUF6010 family protein [Gammaproteobacteria bacterium]
MTESQSSTFSRMPIITAIVIGTLLLAPHLFLPREVSLAFAAVVVGIIAGVYFGFAVVNGSNQHQLIEFNVASAFGIAAILGLTVSPWFLPLSYLAHGAWDVAHHNRLRLRLVSIPQWYIPWCVVIDVIVGVGLIAIWSSKGLI